MSSTDVSLPLAAVSFIGTVAMGRMLLRRPKTNEPSSSDATIQERTIYPQHHSLLPTPAQALHLIETRRSIFTKQFTGKTVHPSVITDMLEAARWAPNHKITEPWRFIVFESQEGREKVGTLLQDLYKATMLKKGLPISQAKFDKKLKGAQLSSHIIAICVQTDTKNPLVEEVSSVAMAVQNMHLMATCHGAGAYWSSGGVHTPDTPSLVENPQQTSQFLRECLPENKKDESILCLGWLYIGDYYGDEAGSKKKWPVSKRTPIEDKVTWK